MSKGNNKLKPSPSLSFGNEETTVTNIEDSLAKFDAKKSVKIDASFIKDEHSLLPKEKQLKMHN